MIIALIIAAAVAATACGASSEGTATPQPTSAPTPTPIPIDLVALLERAGSVMEQVSSFRFRLEHKGGDTQLLPGLLIDEAEGAVVNPDRLSVNFGGSAGTFALQASLITIGDSVFMTNPLSGKWEALQVGVGPQGFFDPGRGIGAMLSGVEQPSLVGDPTGPVLRLRGSVQAEALSSLLGDTLEGVAVDVELDIDAKAYFLLKVRVDGRVTPSDAEEVVRIITVSNFNEPISIEPPE